MDDKACQEFFTLPSQTYQRHYEALRAVFVDGRSQKDVADQFGFTYGTIRQLVCHFRSALSDDPSTAGSLFFAFLAVAQQQAGMTQRSPKHP